MNENNPEDFECSKLDNMPAGTWELRAPIRDGAVQLDVTVPKEFIGLTVVKVEDSVTVERQDGELFQAELELAKGNTRVLEEPVRRLSFEMSRKIGGTALWCAIGEGVRVASQEGVEELAYVIGHYAIKKKERMDREEQTRKQAERVRKRRGY